MIFYHDDYFLPQISQISLLYSPSNVFFAHKIVALRICFFRHEDMRTWFFITVIIFSHKLHKFHFFILPQTSFSPTDCCLTAFVFLDMRTWSFITEIIFSHKLHKFHSFILPQTSFSPTDCCLATFVFFRHEDMRIWFFLTELTFYCVNGNRRITRVAV